MDWGLRFFLIEIFCLICLSSKLIWIVGDGNIFLVFCSFFFLSKVFSKQADTWIPLRSFPLLWLVPLSIRSRAASQHSMLTNIRKHLFDTVGRYRLLFFFFLDNLAQWCVFIFLWIVCCHVCLTNDPMNKTSGAIARLQFVVRLPQHDEGVVGFTVCPSVFHFTYASQQALKLVQWVQLQICRLWLPAGLTGF